MAANLQFACHPPIWFFGGTFPPKNDIAPLGSNPLCERVIVYWSGGPYATKRRTFVVRCKLPLFRTKWLTEVDGKEGIYRNPDVQEMFISLGSVLPKGCVIGPQRVHRLLELPGNEQMLRAKELLREVGMETEGGFD